MVLPPPHGHAERIGVQSIFLEIVRNLTRMAIEVLGHNTADLAKARGWRNADVFTEVVKAFEYPETHPCIKVFRLAHLL
jgi:ABC-type antimicrobial peptide transport system permease subunit